MASALTADEHGEGVGRPAEQAASPVARVRSPGPFSRFERLVAFRYLRSRRSDGFVSVIAGLSLVGIALGVATLIIVMSVMNGFRTELLGKILGFNGHIMIQGLVSGLEDYDTITERVRTVKGVERASPIIDGEVLASAPRAATGALVRGIRQEDLAKFEAISSTLTTGRYPDNWPKDPETNIVLPLPSQEAAPLWAEHRRKILDAFSGRDAVIVGETLAFNLGLRIGDPITLTSPQGASTPFGVQPRSKAYRVVGLFKMGMSEYDSRIAFMPLDEAQRYFNKEGTVSAVEVMVDDPDRVAQYREPIRLAVAAPVQIVDWQDMNASFFSALQVERNVMFFILSMIILVAALNIISGLIMFVKDKGQDIAILRTMGAARGSVMRIFFIAGGSIGVVGTIIGLILGVTFCLFIEDIRQALQYISGVTLFDPTVYFLSEMPAELDPNEVLFVVIISLSLSFLATLYPAYRAARLDPVEALRYE